MGQEQSSTLNAIDTLSVTPSTSTSTKYSVKRSNNQDESDMLVATDSFGSDGQQEEGIIEVVKQSGEEEEEEEIRLLQSLYKFEPFIKENEKSFSIENLLGLKPNTKPATSTDISKQRDALSDPLSEIFFGLQSHIKDNMSHINMEQRILLRRIAYVNELSSASFSVMTNASNQSKLAKEKITEIEQLRDQATKARENAARLFKSLAALEKYLDPEDRIEASINAGAKWPELNELRYQALKASEHPSIERYISSSSDLTTVGTSTSPFLEKIVVNGEPVKIKENSIHPYNTTDTNTSENRKMTSSTSLALDKLRGLSSRSIKVSHETQHLTK